MKMNKRTTICLGIFFVLFLTTVGNAAAGSEQNSAIYEDRIVWQDDSNGNWDIQMYNVSTSTETQITTDEAGQQNPDIYGDRIVWQDSRNGGSGDYWDPTGNWDIHMYNISTSTETRITTNESRQIYSAIYGDKIVWQDDRNGNWDIYMYDISTSTETQITHNVSDQLYPDIYEDRIVWTEGGAIYMYNISTSTETQITPHWWGWDVESDEMGDANGAPFIYGDRIVCEAETGTGNYLIKMYDLSNSTAQTIGLIDDAYSPAIYGDKIVWENIPGGTPKTGDENHDIHMYDISTSTETRITTNDSNQGDPAIYGDRIVWTDYRNAVAYNKESSDIYMYDLSTSEEIRITTSEEEQLAEGTETQITTNESEQFSPVIYEDRIVWTDWRNDNGSYTNSDIYMYDLSTSTETQITTNGSNQMLPAIYGDKIVWVDERNGNEDIYMYDLSSSNETQISSNESNQYGPAIYEDRIVWLDERNSGSVPDDGFGGFDVYMYNLSTKKETQITKSTISINPDMGFSVNIYDNKIVCYMGPYGISVYDLSTRQENVISDLQLYNLAFSGNRIVGTNDWEGREGVVYMYDLSTATKTKITADVSAYGGPDISGNRIVWPDFRNSDHPSSGLDLYMYDLSTSTESRITTSKSVAWSAPSIYGNRIVWQDERNGNSDIYMFTLASDEVPTPDDNDTDEDNETDDGTQVPDNDSDTGTGNETDNGTQVPDNCSDELTPLDSIQALKEYVECTYKCHEKTKIGLASLLDKSMCFYENGEEEKAISMLKSFIHLAESMKECKQISADEADYMVNEAKKILDQMGEGDGTCKENEVPDTGSDNVAGCMTDKVCEETKPVCEETIPVCEPVCEVTKPVCKPVCDETKPVCNPVCEETKPVCDETKPVYTETKPVCTETKPVCTETKPVCKPVCEETKPVCEEPKPVAEPVCEETKPVCEETKPVCKPVCEETKPVEPTEVEAVAKAEPESEPTEVEEVAKVVPAPEKEDEKVVDKAVSAPEKEDEKIVDKAVPAPEKEEEKVVDKAVSAPEKEDEKIVDKAVPATEKEEEVSLNTEKVIEDTEVSEDNIGRIEAN